MSHLVRFVQLKRMLFAAAALSATFLLISAAHNEGPGPAALNASTTAKHPLYGTLDTQISTIRPDQQAGVSVAMFELNWSSFEPENGKFSASYIASMKNFLAKFRAAGMRLTLGLGLQDPPAWVFTLADSRYVDQSGSVSSEADFMFSEPVRHAASLFLEKVASVLPLSDFWAIRLTSGGDAEMLYPSGGSYWAFNKSALTGAGLPPTMKANPFPSWRPGEHGLSAAQINEWVNWYVGALDNVTNYQMTVLTSLGFKGYYQVVTPGSGTRPDDLTVQEEADLPDGVTGVGAVWDRYYSMLTRKSMVVAYISSVADLSGNDDSCQPTDKSLALTSPTMDSWSATRWITRVADANHLLVAGENPGYGMPADLDSHYKDTTSHGMMADAIRQATSCGFQAFYWAHDEDFSNGTASLALFRADIAAS